MNENQQPQPVWNMKAKIKGKWYTLNKTGEPGIVMMGEKHANYLMYFRCTREYIGQNYKDITTDLHDITEIKHFKDGKVYDRLLYDKNKYTYYKDGKKQNNEELEFWNNSSFSRGN